MKEQQDPCTLSALLVLGFFIFFPIFVFGITLMCPLDQDRAKNSDFIVVGRCLSFDSETNQVSAQNVITNYEAFITIEIASSLKGEIAAGKHKIRISDPLIWITPATNENRTMLFWAGSSAFYGEVDNIGSNCIWFLTSSESSFNHSGTTYPTISSPFCTKPLKEEAYWRHLLTLKNEERALPIQKGTNWVAELKGAAEKQQALRQQYIQDEQQE